LKLCAGRHHADFIALFYAALLDANVDDYALVGVVIAVENQRLKRFFDFADRRGDELDYLL
jgi:hypothetical protein